MIFQLALIHILVPIKEVQLNQYKGRYLKVWLKLINSREVKIVKHCNIMILVIRRATVQTPHLLVNLY